MSKNPYKFSKLKRDQYLQHLADGMRRGVAARAVGVTRQTVREFWKDNPDFQQCMDLAEMDADEAVEDALRNAALSGNVPAAFGWLYNRRPDRWQDRRNFQVTHTGIMSIRVKYKKSDD